MASVPIIDMHADVFMDLVRRREKQELSSINTPNSALSESHNEINELVTLHLKRIHSGGIVGAILTDCRMAGERAEPEHLERFIATVQAQLVNNSTNTYKNKIVNSEIQKNELSFIHVLTAKDLDFALSHNIFAVIVGYEGLTATLGELGWFRRLYKEAGLRVAVLTHNDDNCFGGGSLGVLGGLPEPQSLGLTEKGREAVNLCNELGILIDISHAGKATRRDILNTSTVPVIFSHTSSKIVYDNGRNLTAAEMRLIADKGGVIGCMTSPAALAHISDRKHHNLDRYMEHLLSMIDFAGIDHVGLGLHFCEYLYDREKYPFVQGLEDAGHAQAIIKALFNLGFSEKDVEKIAWKNFVRVFRQILH